MLECVAFSSRLLWFVHPKVGPKRLEDLMKLTEPSGTSSGVSADLAPGAGGVVGHDPMIKMHSELKEKVDSHLAAVAKSQSEEEALKGSAENLI